MIGPLKPWQWLTTAPNPRSSAMGYDAGQRGWRLHAVRALPSEKFSQIKYRESACGLMPGHGWDIDSYIERKCARCCKKLGLPLPLEAQIEAQMREEIKRERLTAKK